MTDDIRSTDFENFEQREKEIEKRIRFLHVLQKLSKAMAKKHTKNADLLLQFNRCLGQAQYLFPVYQSTSPMANRRSYSYCLFAKVQAVCENWNVDPKAAEQYLEDLEQIEKIGLFNLGVTGDIKQGYKLMLKKEIEQGRVNENKEIL